MNVLSISRQKAIVAATVGVVALASAVPALAASATWVGGTDANWVTGANWNPAAAPGLATGAITNDIATFNAATPLFGLADNPVIIDLNRSIGGITFSGAAGPYVLGSNAGNQLTLSNIGAAPGTHVIQMAAAVTNAQVIAAPLRFVAPSSTNGGFAFVNNATSSAATLSFTGAISNASSGTRPNVLFLDGTNTGANTISGAISANYNFNGAVTVAPPGQAVPVLIKRGTGTWTLTAANSFTGTMITDTSGNAGIQVLDGVLAIQNGQALGTSATANALQVYVGNKSLTYGYNGALTVTTATASGGGTLELATGITVDNGVSLNLVNGGTIRSNGTNATNGRINVSTIAAANANLTTVGVGDVFTVGNEANDLTGGSATSVVHTAGPGTIVLGQASNYAGSVSVDAGTTRLGNATALGTGGLTFGAGSTGKLQLNGNSVTVNSLTTNATPGSAVIENGAGGTSLLTVNSSTTGTFAGVIQDGAAGQTALTKSGAGTLSLAGIGSTYTGNTSVTGGFLLANNTAGSATGTGNTVTVSGTGRLGGSGGTASSVVVNSGGGIAPGTAGVNNGIGSLHVGTLTLDAGSQLDYDIISSAIFDQTFVDTSGGLTINGGQFNLNGGVGSFTTNGVYNLIGYTGGIGGTGVSALTVNAINQDTVNKSYSFGTAGGFVTLTIASVGASANFYNVDANGNWSNPANWTIGVPNSVGAFAAFGGGGATITANRTVTVDGAFTVGTIAFNNPTFSYTLAQGAGGLLTLDNGASTSFVSDSVGNHFIQVPLALTANGANFSVLGVGDTLAVSGGVSGNGTLTKSGAGILALTGTNTYTGGTVLNAGTVQINSGASLGDASGALTFNGGRLQVLADITTARNYQVSGSNDAVIDTNGQVLTVTGNVVPVAASTGGVVKNGAGTLALSGTNTYTGTTTVNAGTVSINSNASLGAVGTGAAVILNGGTLASTASLALNNGGAATNARPVTLGTGGGTLAPAAATTLTVSGAITGSGALTKADAGQVTLLTPTVGQNTYTGGTVLTGGRLLLGEIAAVNSGLGTGGVTFDGGTLSQRYGGNAIPNVTSGFTNNLFVATGSTGTLIAGGRTDNSGTLTGGGTLNISVDYVRSNFLGNYSGFTGQINITNGPNGGDFRINNGFGFGVAKINIGAGVNVYDIVNFGAGGQTLAIGELSGVTGGFLSSGPTAGRVLTYAIGGANTNSQFDGVIRDQTGITAITKNGTGSLTLTGANAYSGVTTINAGTLAINGQFALGGALYSGTTFNGGTLQYTAGFAGNGSGDITADSNGVAKNVTIAAGGATIDTNGNNVSFANAVGNAGVGGLTKTGSGTLTLNAASTYTGTTVVKGGTLKLASAAEAAYVAGTAVVDVQRGSRFVLDYTGGSSPVAQIKTILDAGYTNNFSTSQIRSTTATPAIGLGYGDDGVGAVTVLATYYGDADLDGKVDFNDFLKLQTNYNVPGTRFDQGNFNYDGQTDFNDFLVLQTNFGSSVNGMNVSFTTEQVGIMNAFFAANTTEVPEPASLAVLGLGATALLRRRRA